jgi:hypothetical protein
MYAKVSIQGNIIEKTVMEHRNRCCNAIKIDAEHWMDANGEIHEYEKKSDKRTDNIQELKNTFKKIRALVNTNCIKPNNIRWITLTYAENMTDTKRLYKDFERFWKRYKRRWGKAEYISVIEPQGRGAWHIHLIVIHPDVAPFIPNNELAECWGQGFVNVKSVKDCDNLGAYLSAYLGDTVVKEGEPYTCEKKCKDGTTKRILKGGRLHMYPKGMNIYRHSRGVKQPEEYWIETEEDMERTADLLEGAAMTYSKEYVWKDEETGEEHRVWKEFYNTKRRPKGYVKPQKHEEKAHIEQSHDSADTEAEGVGGPSASGAGMSWDCSMEFMRELLRKTGKTGGKTGLYTGSSGKFPQTRFMT